MSANTRNTRNTRNTNGSTNGSTKQMARLESLPYDLFREILSYTGNANAIAASRASKELRDMSGDRLDELRKKPLALLQTISENISKTEEKMFSHITLYFNLPQYYIELSISDRFPEQEFDRKRSGTTNLLRYLVKGLGETYRADDFSIALESFKYLYTKLLDYISAHVESADLRSQNGIGFFGTSACSQYLSEWATNLTSGQVSVLDRVKNGFSDCHLPKYKLSGIQDQLPAITLNWNMSGQDVRRAAMQEKCKAHFEFITDVALQLRNSKLINSPVKKYGSKATVVIA